MGMMDDYLLQAHVYILDALGTRSGQSSWILVLA